ncbi:hypothetical protein LY90DRAFT_668581 [Neocallimastix californiae]|uniref:NDT80 domain-containing protein n=1 Tax=Neocallimastix californiae TaxID=1754190 RepID=A0A1Y2DP96_9FUNG|nr:hypothetical protein LY90DRAFT_668581 [Neocallimastix californiae]|eukprot:ORY61112.1 hypothetical protein LY90DRAFT_668581 [Neocallimastix californiae]
MDTNNPMVNYPTPPTTSHNFSAFSFNIKSDSQNYPYSYSPTLNNCISSTDSYPIVSSNIKTEDNTASPNMNNYNGINMYNTTSIISGNDGSTLNSSNNNNNSYGNTTGNTYPTSNQTPSNDTFSSFQSYSNINYANINNSIQPLSPKEISYMDKSQVIVDSTQQNTPQNSFNGYNQESNQSSQQNYVNYNTFSDQSNNQFNNNNNSTGINNNSNNLTLDTSFSGSNNDTSSSLMYANNGQENNNSYDIKTPTCPNSQMNSNQVNTPPTTPMPEKSKKKRGDHIHYNIKTNMFEETQQYYEIFNYEKTKPYNIRIIPKVDRGFFPTGPENDFTCYRRNYFQISVSFTADNIKNPNEFTMPSVMKFGDSFLTVENFYIGICAKVKGGTKAIRVVQQTAKREKGPQNKPVPKLCKPGGNPSYYHGLTSNQSIVTFERLQFKSATPNSSKRSGTQQFYTLVIDLYADTTQHKRYKVASIESKRLIVRGRSPGHYAANGEYDNIPFSNRSLSTSSTESTTTTTNNTTTNTTTNNNNTTTNNNNTTTNNNNTTTNNNNTTTNNNNTTTCTANCPSYYGNGNQGYGNNGNDSYPTGGGNNYSTDYNNMGGDLTSISSNQDSINYNNNYTNNQNMNFMAASTNNNQFQSNMNSNQSPYTPSSYSQLPYNDSGNSYDNYNSTASSANSSAITGTSYPNESAGTIPNNNGGDPGFNYQNNNNFSSTNDSSNSYYSFNNSSMDSSSQNGYMYQTPPLQPQQNPSPQSIDPTLTYNVSKQEVINPYSTDSQNAYSPYVQGTVNLFPSQTQSSDPSSYSSNNYYPQNTNSNTQMSQNVNTGNNSQYYSQNNQDLIFSTLPFNQTDSFTTPDQSNLIAQSQQQQQTSNTVNSMNQ